MGGAIFLRPDFGVAPVARFTRATQIDDFAHWLVPYVPQVFLRKASIEITLASVDDASVCEEPGDPVSDASLDDASEPRLMFPSEPAGA